VKKGRRLCRRPAGAAGVHAAPRQTVHPRRSFPRL